MMLGELREEVTQKVTLKPSVGVEKKGGSQDASEVVSLRERCFPGPLMRISPEQGVPGPYTRSAAPGDSSAASPALWVSR